LIISFAVCFKSPMRNEERKLQIKGFVAKLIRSRERVGALDKRC